MSRKDLRPPRLLLDVRTTLILLLAGLIGIAAGALTYLGGQPWPIAVLAGAGAGAAAVRFFDTFVS